MIVPIEYTNVKPCLSLLTKRCEKHNLSYERYVYLPSCLCINLVAIHLEEGSGHHEVLAHVGHPNRSQLCIFLSTQYTYFTFAELKHNFRFKNTKKKKKHRQRLITLTRDM